MKVVSHDHARLIDKIRVTETVFPERESGIRLGTRISHRALLDYVQLGSDFSLQESMDRIQPVPDPDAPLKDSDTLLVAGADESLGKAAKVR